MRTSVALALLPLLPSHPAETKNQCHWLDGSRSGGSEATSQYTGPGGVATRRPTSNYRQCAEGSYTRSKTLRSHLLARDHSMEQIPSWAHDLSSAARLIDLPVRSSTSL